MNHKSMNNPTVSIADLPDEILLIIFKKLHNFDVLYLLVGVNKKLDRVACDLNFTQSVDLMTISLNGVDKSTTNAILDRFCMDILPRIHNKLECLTVEGCFLHRVIHASYYLNLRKITLVDVELNMASHIFNEKSPFINTFRHQIADLVVTITDEFPDASMEKSLIAIYDSIFVLLTNLKSLNLDVHSTYPFSRSFLTDSSSTRFSLSNIVHLRIKMHNINDCLYLLDGRLSQLHTLIVDLDYIHDVRKFGYKSSTLIHDSLKIMNNSNTALKLKCFSLFAYFTTGELDKLVMPLLCRMPYLEKLTLSLRLRQRISLIEDIFRNYYILSQMSHLHTFHFDIVIEHSTYMYKEQLILSPNDIRRRFFQRGLDVDCYIDYHYHKIRRIHVYSLPTNMEPIQYITHSFPGGTFFNVRVLRMFDDDSPFEYGFFAQISRSFPLLSSLTIISYREQKEKVLHKLMKSEEASSIIEYPHLKELYYGRAHIDYVEQFLSTLNTRLPCLSKLHVKYEHLKIVTENFTRNTTRINCAKVKHITFDRGVAMVRSKDFNRYFPLL